MPYISIKITDMEKTLTTTLENAEEIEIIVNYDYINDDILDDDYIFEITENRDKYYISDITAVNPDHQDEINLYYNDIINEVIDEL